MKQINGDSSLQDRVPNPFLVRPSFTFCYLRHLMHPLTPSLLPSCEATGNPAPQISWRKYETGQVS